MISINKVTSISLLLVIIVVSLIFLKSILVPLILAIIFWLIVVEVRTLIGNLLGSDKNKIPVWIQNILATLTIFAIFFVAIKMLSISIQNLTESLSHYDGNLILIEDKVNNLFDIDITTSLNKMIGDYNFTSLLKNILTSVTGLFGNTFTIILYVVFLLLEESVFSDKLVKIYPDAKEYKAVVKMIAKIGNSVSSYLTLKSFVSLLTGVLSYMVLKLMGIDAPFFWALLIFALNYIPTIGSLIATLFPAFFTVIQFADLSSGLIVLLSVGVIQVIIGNLVEPKVMGNSLNISGLVVLIALAFWGALWGVVGMILSVPITVMMIIIFGEFDATRPIAIILSENGNTGISIQEEETE
ncbi:AI-2E family transporter [Flammeovirga kamogawensis]|uniref:AI-2E family transporter n=1 Tax=Flammeovirga kamogawensis TaxID=373891 RepID=A0ABX8GX17_9BACT|nr:AI-2E family transporter [Flammeovirga kamogawensis]QWG07752.1 AI-2E family transporter [Flammeovirga kamogawensis]TRX69558.1 AI-2E family transporter [Flammeovirga kamogawensis]